MSYQQSPRCVDDGPIAVRRLPGVSATSGVEKLSIRVNDCDTNQEIICTEYNAARLLGALAAVLGVRINVQDARGIKMT